MLYDDGESEHLLLSAETIRWDKRPPGHRSVTPPTAANPTQIPTPPTSPPEPTHQTQPSEEPAAPPAEQPATLEGPGGGTGDAAVAGQPEPDPQEDKATEAARLAVN